MSKSLADIMKEKLEAQEKIKDLKPPKPSPPRAPPKQPKQPRPQKIEEEKEEPTSFKIDWVKVAQSSDFKRAVYLALEGKTFRGKNENLDKELNKKMEFFRDPNFSGVVKELKEKFKNGLIKPSEMV